MAFPLRMRAVTMAPDVAIGALFMFMLAQPAKRVRAPLERSGLV